MWKKETKRTYIEGDAAGQLEPRSHVDTKAVRKELYLTKKG